MKKSLAYLVYAFKYWQTVFQGWKTYGGALLVLVYAGVGLYKGDMDYNEFFRNLGIAASLAGLGAKIERKGKGE